MHRPIAPTPSASVADAPRGSSAIAFLIFLGLACIAYFPSLRGGFLWDDDGHVTRADLRTLAGLYRIWFEPGATQQYYPLLHSVFWLEQQLWGDAVTGYHLVNVVWHALAATLFFRGLRRLAVPGAWLAAGLFLLHPVCVESVAWISEQKNTLSLVLYLTAALTYLGFERDRRPQAYFAATGVFVLALLTKTVTASLPAALLVVFWWQRGRLEWRRDVRPLMPWFLLGATAGLFTAWAERKLIGAEGADFALGFGERLLLAGRVVWFYAGKLIWPADLTFIYPRWEVDAGAPGAWLFPLAALALLAGLFRWRGRSRAPLAAALLFGGSLFPVLGFFNVYPFMFSWVADHFQYLASLGLLALAGATLARLPRAAFLATGGAWLAVCALLTWRQAGLYRDEFTLYAATLGRNPDAWMAHNNLAIALVEARRAEEALPHYEAAVRLRPDYARGEHNFGFALNQLGRHAEAIPHLQRAVALKPGYASAHNELGAALLSTGRSDEGRAHLQNALRLSPDFAMAHRNLGLALAIDGHVAEALPHFQKAVQLLPTDVELRLNLSLAFAAGDRFAEAATELETALAQDPRSAPAHFQLALVLQSLGRTEDANAHYREAVRLDPQIGR